MAYSMIKTIDTLIIENAMDQNINQFNNAG